MADSINIPQNLTRIFEVKDTSEPLKRFLTDLLIRVQNLEKSNSELTKQVNILSGNPNAN